MMSRNWRRSWTPSCADRDATGACTCSATAATLASRRLMLSPSGVTTLGSDRRAKPVAAGRPSTGAGSWRLHTLVLQPLPQAPRALREAPRQRPCPRPSCRPPSAASARPPLFVDRPLRAALRRPTLETGLGEPSRTLLTEVEGPAIPLRRRSMLVPFTESRTVWRRLRTKPRQEDHLVQVLNHRVFEAAGPGCPRSAHHSRTGCRVRGVGGAIDPSGRSGAPVADAGRWWGAQGGWPARSGVWRSHR